MGNGSSFSSCLTKPTEGSIFQLEEPTAGAAWLDIPIETLRDRIENIKLDSLNSRESLQNRVERYISALCIPLDQMRRMRDSFVHELEVGLEAHKAHPLQWKPNECSFKMFDSCIESLPSGKENGVFYALDFGGTNFRVVRVKLSGNGKLIVSQRQESLLSALSDRDLYPKGLMDRNASAMQLFDFFARIVHEFMEAEEDLQLKGVQCGFTFSFPCSQRRVDSARLVTWTKGFETGRATDDPVEELDVAELMNVAFQRNNVPIECNSVLNDTVGTLLSCAYEMDQAAHPPCMVGMILGTGMNCCYFDSSTPQFGYIGKIVNIECGNFNRDLPRTNIDCELDFKAVDNRGYQQIEKMCSGAYLGEICRMTVVRIFQHRAPPLAWEVGSLTSEQVAKILNDKSKELIVTEGVLSEAWRTTMSAEDLKIAHRIATAVMDRSAALAAVMIAGCGHKTGRLQPAFGGLSVGIDGSLYKKNPWYQERVRVHLDALLGSKLGSLVHLLTADDGSGKGAAILAATVASRS